MTFRENWRRFEHECENKDSYSILGESKGLGPTAWHIGFEKGGVLEREMSKSIDFCPFCGEALPSGVPAVVNA